MNITSYDTFAQYLKTEKGRSPNTVTAYLLDIKGFRRHLDTAAMQGLPPTWAEVQAKHIRAYLAALPDAKEHRIHRIVSSLRTWFNYLEKIEKEIIGNPALEISKPKLPQRLPKHLEPHQVAQVLAAVEKHSRAAEKLRNWALIGFLYGTGLRISEALNLTFDKIQYQEGYPVGVRVIGKGNKERVVPLSPTGQRALHQWLKHRKMEGTPTLPYVWVNTIGRMKDQRLSVRAAHNLVNLAAKEAGLGKLSPHKLRHSYGTALANSGRPLHEIKAVMGHASVATTQLYVHASQKGLEATAAALPDVLDVSPT